MATRMWCQSWLGILLLIPAQVTLSTTEFTGFTCDDVCDSLLDNRSSNLSYIFTVAPNSTANDSTLNFFCNDTGSLPHVNLGAMNDWAIADTVYTPCTSVYEEDYVGTELRVVNVSLTASALNISRLSCLRACAFCKVDLECSYTEEEEKPCRMEEVITCTRTELGVFLSKDEMLTKLRSINDSYDRYKSVIDRVVSGVLITDADKPMCLAAYRKWLCRTKLPILLPTSEELSSLRPCLEVCWEVLVECPFFLPAQLQFSRRGRNFQEEQYAGTPVFDCPRVDSVMQGRHSRYRVCANNPAHLKDYNRPCL